MGLTPQPRYSESNSLPELRLFLAATKESRQAIGNSAKLDSDGTFRQLAFVNDMLYSHTDNRISLGDRVLIDGKVKGVVVCDYDSWKSLDGYESWLTKEQLVGGGMFSSGIMVETKELGFLHYAEGDEDIALDGSHG